MDSVIIVAIVVVFALGLIVGTRSQTQRPCSHGSMNEVREVILLMRQLNERPLTKKTKQKKK
mgnify:CR=1 FL=1